MIASTVNIPQNVLHNNIFSSAAVANKSKFFSEGMFLYRPLKASSRSKKDFSNVLIYKLSFFQLYHACDQDVFSFCLMKYTVLQFCDFYTATMAYWVTVLAMGGLPDQAKSLLHMVGAIGMSNSVFKISPPDVSAWRCRIGWVQH